VAGAGLALGCAAASAVSPSADDAAESVLFIGNRLTESNGLPARVAEIANSAGHAVAAGALRLDAGRRDLLVDAACSAAPAARR
jgi:hypothetical protein